MAVTTAFMTSPHGPLPRTGIKRYVNSCRRTFATESVRNGMNLFHVQSLLGHSSLTMTRIYEQDDSEDAIKAQMAVVR